MKMERIDGTSSGKYFDYKDVGLAAFSSCFVVLRIQLNKIYKWQVLTSSNKIDETTRQYCDMEFKKHIIVTRRLDWLHCLLALRVLFVRIQLNNISEREAFLVTCSNNIDETVDV